MQMPLQLEQRGRFTPPVKLATDTSAAAAGDLGLSRAGDLAAAMVGVIERNAAKVRLGGVMLAIEVRGEVHRWLREHPEGATADEVAYALKYSILTVRPRVSELYKLGLIVDSGLRRKNASGKNAIVWIVKGDTTP